MTAVRLSAAAVGDLAAMAALHAAAFPESALTRLGRESVRRYYEWLVTGPHDSTALVAFVGDEIAGFGIGGIFNGAMTGFLRANRGYLVARLTTRPWLLASPLIRQRAHRAWRLLTRRVAAAMAPGATSPRPAASPGGSAVARTAPGKSFGVLALAVDPRHRRHGIGRHIMDALDDTARRQGFAEMDLSVHPENVGAVRFYERLGWQRDTARDWRGVMRKRLD